MGQYDVECYSYLFLEPIYYVGKHRVQRLGSFQLDFDYCASLLSDRDSVLTRFPCRGLVITFWPDLRSDYRSIVSCEGLYLLERILSLVFYSVWAGQSRNILPSIICKFLSSVFSALRVYTISIRDWRLTLITLGFGLVPVFTNIVSIVVGSAESFC